jgi:hypothetical protein
MKRIVLSLMLLAGLAGLLADVVNTYTLSAPEVKTSGAYSLVKLPGAQTYGVPGQPDLPWFGTKLLLPIGEEAVDIEVKLSGPQSYTLSNPIAPIQPQYPLSWEQLPNPVGPDPAIYGSDSLYPLIAHNGVNTQFLSGHPINFSAICPFTYDPLDNELIFYRNLTVRIITSPTARASVATQLLKQDSHTAGRLLESVDNQSQVTRYDTRESGYDYVIIHDQAKLAQWQPFQALYESRGMNVLMKSVQDITSQFTGVDTQEKIRNFIISLYAGNPLKHVLLAGDTDVIPHRGFYVNMGTGSEVDADIPADMYYSCLDGTWNSDNDNLWGEHMETDLAPELSIGRFCYNTDDEIANFINKTSSYLNEPVVSEATSTLFVGEWLWDGPTWGGDYMDEMIGGSSANGYTTVGVPTSWSIGTLYDRTYGYADAWDGNQLRPLLSNGPALVNHLGHSATTYTMRLSNNQVTPTTITNNGDNHNFSIVFTQGCYSGSFDNRETNPGQYTSDCITEKFTSISTAAVAMIAHSRYGWGMQGSTDGASQHIHREYIDAIFGEGIRELGFTLSDSKLDNIPYIQNTPVMYWVTYETNLIGDPGLMVWGNTPQQIVAQLPSYWTVGLNTYQIQTNAPNSILRLKDGQDIICEANADATGLITINLTQTLNPGNYDLYIIASDFHAYHSVITVQASNMPYIVATGVQYLDADGLYHTGEVINMNVTLKNVGLVNQIEPGTVTLASNSPNISIINNTYGFDPLVAADSTMITGFFSFRIQGNYEDHETAQMTFTTMFDGYTANTPVSLTLNAPELNLDTYQFINDTPVIMPGDNPSLNIIVSNSGSGNAYSPLLILFSSDPNVTLSASEAILTPVGSDSFVLYEDVFSVQVSPTAPMGSSATIGYMLGAENGNTLEGNFVLYIGAQNYNFENDMNGWTSLQPLTNFVNQWHRSNNRNSTPNGAWSMKFGGQGSNDYSGAAYGALESPEFSLGLESHLHFQHWMDAETHSNPLYAWDGGLVQMSLDGGEWFQITPEGGYPYRTYSNPASPFPAETNVYSGTFDWTEAVFDLSNYSGMARFRFVFGSDGYVAGEGWYIDDIYVVSTVANEDNVASPARFTLHENYPNPFNPTTTIRFELPVSGEVSLDIYNLKGQRVRSLVGKELEKGTHSIVWNGRDDRGGAVASGIYLYRLQSGDLVQTRKMMLMK